MSELLEPGAQVDDSSNADAGDAATRSARSRSARKRRAGASDAQADRASSEPRHDAGEGSDPRVARASSPSAWVHHYPGRDDHRRALAKNLAIAGAVTVALAGVLYASWPGEAGGLFGRNAVPPLSAEAERAAFAALGGDPTARAPDPTALAGIPSDPAATGELDAGAGAILDAGLSPEEQAAMASDAGAASASLGQWFSAADSGGDKLAPLPGPAAIGGAGALLLPGTAPPAGAETRGAVVAATPVAGAATGAGSSPSAGAGAGAAVPAGAASASTAIAAVPSSNGVTRGPAGMVASARSADAAIATPAKYISGGPSDADNRGGGYRGTVVVQFTVRPEGSAGECGVARSSGNAALDALTCKIVVERARFAPAKDASGRSVATRAFASYLWGRGRRPKG